MLHCRQTKMVMSLAKKTSDPLLAFSQLLPIYISPDTKVGDKDCKQFFPPPDVFAEEYEESVEGEELEEGEDIEDQEEEEGEEEVVPEDEVEQIVEGSIEKSISSETNVSRDATTQSENPPEYETE